MTTVEIPEELRDRLLDLARQARMSLDDYVAHALKRYLEDQEDYLIALEESAKLGQTLEDTLSYEEVVKELDLA